MQRGESALQIAVRKGHLDVVKVLVQVCRNLQVDQYYMDLAGDHHHEHLVEYLSSEFPTLKRKVTHRLQYSTNTYAPPVLLFGHTNDPSAACHITCLVAAGHIHFASVGISYSDVFIHACRYEGHSNGRLRIPKYGLYPDLVIQTTSTVKQHVLCSSCNTALDDNIYTHKSVTELIFR